MRKLSLFTSMHHSLTWQPPSLKTTCPLHSSPLSLPVLIFCQAFSSTSNTWRLFLPYPHHFHFILLCSPQTPLQVPLFLPWYISTLISSGPFATLPIFPHLSPFWLIPTCNILSTPIAFLLPPSLFLVLLPSISLLAVPWIKENVIMTV